MSQLIRVCSEETMSKRRRAEKEEEEEGGGTAVSFSDRRMCIFLETTGLMSSDYTVYR